MQSEEGHSVHMNLSKWLELSHVVWAHYLIIKGVTKNGLSRTFFILCILQLGESLSGNTFLSGVFWSYYTRSVNAYFSKGLLQEYESQLDMKWWIESWAGDIFQHFE